jgi:hypothetical protein
MAKRTKGHVRYLTYSRIAPVPGLEESVAPLIDMVGATTDLAAQAQGEQTWVQRSAVASYSRCLARGLGCQWRKRENILYMNSVPCCRAST